MHWALWVLLLLALSVLLLGGLLWLATYDHRVMARDWERDLREAERNARRRKL